MKRRESQRVEFKESWQDEYLKWVCGFANAQGGVIYIGVNDDGEACGVKNCKKLMEDLPNKIRDTTGLMPKVELLEEAGFDIIRITIEAASYPVCFRGGFYRRIGATNQLLNGNALTQFLLKRTGTNWDAIPVDGVSARDLDKESFDIFRRDAKESGRLTAAELRLSNIGLLSKLGLLVDGRLTRAAVMLFHREQERWFPGAYTKVGLFNGAEIVYMDEVHGSLLLQADRTIDLIYLKYLKAVVSYRKETRIETYPYPREALREAYFNALMHSNYGAGNQIQIKIESRNLHISNLAVTPDGWTAKNLLATHTSEQYNPHIAMAFFRAGYVEAWGRGIKKMFDACDAAKAPRPKFTLHPYDFMISFEANPAGVLVDRQGDQLGDQLGDQSGGANNGVQLSEQILNALRVEPKRSLVSLASSLGVSPKTVKQYVARLKDEGALHRIGGTRGHWEVTK